MTMMPADRATAPDVPNSRARTITTILVILMAIMIVMDIFARRRAAATPALPDVTQRWR
jgi:hypothetical protein